MSWDCLSAEVAVMFADYSDREYEQQLTLEWWVRERRAVDQARDQKRRNDPHRIEYLRTLRANNAERQRKYDRDYYERNKEKRREYFRQRRAMQRETRRAA